MKNVQEEVLLEPEQDQVTIHDSLEMEKEVKEWIQQILKLMLSEI
jgi:hypothetical protein